MSGKRPREDLGLMSDPVLALLHEKRRWHLQRVQVLNEQIDRRVAVVLEQWRFPKEGSDDT